MDDNPALNVTFPGEAQKAFGFLGYGEMLYALVQIGFCDGPKILVATPEGKWKYEVPNASHVRVVREYLQNLREKADWMQMWADAAGALHSGDPSA